MPGIFERGCRAFFCARGKEVVDRRPGLNFYSDATTTATLGFDYVEVRIAGSEMVVSKHIADDKPVISGFELGSPDGK